MKKENAQKIEEPKVTSVSMEAANEKEIDYKDLYLRTLADMDNLRKNTTKKINDIYKMANDKLIKELLPFIDSLNSSRELIKSLRKDHTVIADFQKVVLLYENNLYICNGTSYIFPFSKPLSCCRYADAHEWINLQDCANQIELAAQSSQRSFIIHNIK